MFIDAYLIPFLLLWLIAYFVVKLSKLFTRQLEGLEGFGTRVFLLLGCGMMLTLSIVAFWHYMHISITGHV